MAHEKNCLNCGKAFTGNINRQFCIDACRKYYRRHGNVSLTGVSQVAIADKGGFVRTTPRTGGSSLGNYAAKKSLDVIAKVIERSLTGPEKTTSSGISHTPNDTPLQIVSAAKSLNDPFAGGLLLNKVFLSEEMQAFLGTMTYPFKMLVWGLPGSGKSTFCMKLANEIASRHRLLYIAGEEALNSQTLLDKQRRMIHKGNAKNCIFINRLPKSQVEWKQVLYPVEAPQQLSTKVIIYDSVTKLDITPFFVNAAANDYQLPAFTKQLSHVFISHAHKDGQQYRGDGSWGHEVDVIIRVENGVAITEKNRFGKVVGSTLKIF